MLSGGWVCTVSLHLQAPKELNCHMKFADLPTTLEYWICVRIFLYVGIHIRLDFVNYI